MIFVECEVDRQIPRFPGFALYQFLSVFLFYLVFFSTRGSLFLMLVAQRAGRVVAVERARRA